MNGKTFCAHGLEELMLKCLYYPRNPLTQCNPYQNSKGIFHRNTAILKFIQTHKTLRNKNIARCIMLLFRKGESVEIKI